VCFGRRRGDRVRRPLCYTPRGRPSLSRACAPSTGRAPGARRMCGFPACDLCARRSGVASVLGEARAPFAAPPRGSNLGVRKHVRGAEPAPPWAPRASAARIRKQPDVRGMTLGCRWEAPPRIGYLPHAHVARLSHRISCLGTGRGDEHGRGEGGARERQRRRRILQFTSRRAFGRNSIQTTLGPSWPQFFPSSALLSRRHIYQVGVPSKYVCNYSLVLQLDAVQYVLLVSS
jgi:hypothetical protein